MAINDFETSRDRGQPVELIQFIHGSEGQSFFYTDGEKPVTLDGNVYDPLPVSRGKIESKAKLEGREIRIEVPLSAAVSELFRIFPPGRVVNVILRQGHVPNEDDPVEWALGENFPVVWTGRVLETSRGDNSTTLTCEALSAGMRRPGLRKHYQWPCPLVLYGPRCQAVKTPILAAVLSITGNKVTLANGWLDPLAPGDFIGGLIEWAGASGPESRGILRVEDSVTIVMSGPATGLSVAAEVTVLKGCPHTLAGCENLHDNVQNYGGFPWIPDGVNPVGRNNHS